MQEGILQVGKAVYDDKNALINLVKDIQLEDRKGNPKHIIQINIDTNKNKIEINDYGEVTKNSAKDLLWIGTASGTSSPQWYVTGNKNEYLISQTLPNIANMELPYISKKLEKIIDDFYYDMGEQKGTKNRYRYIMDIKKISEDFQDMDTIFNENNKDVKKTTKYTSKIIDNYIKDKYGLNNKSITLYFISIDGVPLSHNKEYKNAIKEERYGLDNKAKDDYCSLCSNLTDVTSDTSKLQLKFYTTTNINFPSNFSKKNYYKNMQICSNCLTYLMTGEQYIMDNLNTRLGGMPVYIIPHFLFDPEFSRKNIDLLSSKIVDTFNQAKNVEGLSNIGGEIDTSFEMLGDNNYYLLNILFYRINQKSVKVQKLIKDVNPSRFTHMINAANNIIIKFKELISNRFNMPLGLQSIYYLTPVKLKDGQVSDFRKLLSIYNDVFKGNEIKKDILIKGFIDMVKIHYFNKENQFNIKPNNIFSNSIVQSNMLIRLLEEIGCLKEGEGMNINIIDVDEDMKNYLDEMKYSEQQTAMFILGYLVSQVGNRQYMDREGRKPILNKINFNSMDINKVKRLSSEIVNKLRQNKILKYNEKIYFVHKMLLDKHINRWELSKHDNLYYILSGYSYGTTKMMFRKEKNNDKE